jgi:hypothetical protein
MRVVIENLDPQDEQARRIAWALRNIPKRSSHHPLDSLQGWLDGQVDRFLQYLEWHWLSPFYWTWLLTARFRADEPPKRPSTKIIYHA